MDNLYNQKVINANNVFDSHFLGTNPKPKSIGGCCRKVHSKDCEDGWRTTKELEKETRYRYRRRMTNR